MRSSPDLFAKNQVLTFSVDQPQIMAGNSMRMGSAPMMDSAGMEGSVAFGGAAGAGPTGQIRKEFPETWIWTSSIAKYV